MPSQRRISTGTGIIDPQEVLEGSAKLADHPNSLQGSQRLQHISSRTAVCRHWLPAREQQVAVQKELA